MSAFNLGIETSISWVRAYPNSFENLYTETTQHLLFKITGLLRAVGLTNNSICQPNNQ